MAQRSCADTRHVWSPTSAPGWFCCTRLLDSKPVKGRSFGITVKAVYCQVVAHCPGCVGARYAQVPIVLCAAHQTCSVECFPVVYPVARTSRTTQEEEQPSLW